MQKSVDDFWNEYLVWAKKPPDTKYIDCYHYGYNEELAESLLSLVLSGKKTAA